MDITLKVQPDVLISKAGELTNEKGTVLGLMDQAKSSITSLTGTWKSDASETYQGKFRQIYTDIDNMLAIIAEYANSLTKIAEEYRTGESTARSVADGLPVSGVFGGN